MRGWVLVQKLQTLHNETFMRRLHIKDFTRLPVVKPSLGDATNLRTRFCLGLRDGLLVAGCRQSFERYFTQFQSNIAVTTTKYRITVSRNVLKAGTPKPHRELCTESIYSGCLTVHHSRRLKLMSNYAWSVIDNEGPSPCVQPRMSHLQILSNEPCTIQVEVGAH